MPRKFYLIFSACLTIALLVATCVCFFFEKRILEMSGMNWVVASFVIGFLTATNLGVAPLGWVVSAELLPTTAKKVGLSVLHGARWSTGALVTYLFPIVSEIAGMQYVFLWHTLYMVFYLAFVAFFVPETKGKTEPEIQQLIQQQVPWLISPQPLPPRNDPAPTVEEDSTNE
ncbi:unnamed protein product [Notodromas monacha]|uniref:Major facilitator superfamily (MFS) profile domain-containing protein n=1 Tax=Notodromas monacha TaxID=399045 RepID=A0A7R9GJI9_9CRUS|nr:unnamed protein product [Notodromas monacha]CAG0922869.1 unnamed protein product [Notodromas monacha]